MKQYLRALLTLDPVASVRTQKDAIENEHKETIEEALKSLDHDKLGGTRQLLARKWVSKRSPAVFTELLQASFRRAVAQETFSIIINEAESRRAQQIADMSPLVEVALQAVEAKLTEQRQAVVEADAKRFAETEMDEPSAKTLALFDRKLEAVKKGRACVKRDVQSALGFLSEACNLRPPTLSKLEQYQINEDRLERERVARETAAEREESDRVERRHYAINGRT